MGKKRKIMVCVTQQKSCERLINYGGILKRHGNDEMHIVHVVKENWKYFGQLKEADALEYLFEKAKEHRAQLSVIKAKDIEETLKDFAEDKKIDIIVMGESLEKSAQQNMINRLQNKTEIDIRFEIVPLGTEYDLQAPSA